MQRVYFLGVIFQVLLPTYFYAKTPAVVLCNKVVSVVTTTTLLVQGYSESYVCDLHKTWKQYSISFLMWLEGNDNSTNI